MYLSWSSVSIELFGGLHLLPEAITVAELHAPNLFTRELGLSLI